MTDELDFSALLDKHDYDSPKQGDIRTGVIVRINAREAIIDLGLKRDGIVPQSDLSKLTPEDRNSLKVGDEIDVFVLDTESHDGLTVSIFQARLNQDWIEVEKLLQADETVEVTIIGYNRGGAIAPYGNIRGFIPSSQLSNLSRGMDERQRQQVLSKMREQPLQVKIVEVDRSRRRLVFSERAARREVEGKQREKLLSKLDEGDKITGRVTSLRDFGAFVDIGGVDGLIHISELAWHRVKHPRDILQVGDEVETLILKVDREGERIALSRRKALPSPWDDIDERYVEGQLVEGRVVRIMDYGAFIQLEPGIEGLLHISQLAPVEVQNVNELVRNDETHLLRVISVDPQRKRIGLSLKQVRVQEQMDWMAARQVEEDGADATTEEETVAAFMKDSDSQLSEEE